MTIDMGDSYNPIFLWLKHSVSTSKQVRVGSIFPRDCMESVDRIIQCVRWVTYHSGRECSRYTGEALEPLCKEALPSQLRMNLGSTISSVLSCVTWSQVNW